MNKKILKNISIGLCVGIIFLNVLTVFATSNEKNDNRPQKNLEMPQRKKENEIIGKITYIDENKITISVATRNEIKNKNLPKNEIKQNSENKKALNEKAPDKNINFDDMFVLTGETKTLNIKNADFGENFDKDKNLKNNNDLSKQNEKVENNTYKDYSVGDYVMIEATDNKFTTAKSIRSATFGGFRGMVFDRELMPKEKLN